MAFRKRAQGSMELMIPQQNFKLVASLRVEIDLKSRLPWLNGLRTMKPRLRHEHGTRHKHGHENPANVKIIGHKHDYIYFIY